MENLGAGQQRGAEPPSDHATARTWGALVRRQNRIHMSIAILGGVLVAMGFVLLILQLGDALSYVLVGKGVALTLIGFVGLLMSYTTQDVAQGIRDAIRTDGELTRAVMIDVQNRMLEKLDASIAVQNRMLEKQDRMLEKLDASIAVQNRILEKLDASIAVQNRILEKVS